MSGVSHFPVGRISDARLIQVLTVPVRQAIAEHPAASPDEIAEVALRAIDPGNTSPPMVREGARAALADIARSILASPRDDGAE
jgi:hypothetical protein